MNREDRTIGINRCALFEEISGSTGSVQYDDDLPKSMKRQDAPCRLGQKRTSAKEEFVPYIFEN
jgi:hypothetical protein